MTKQNILTTFAIALASTALGIFAYHLYATEQRKQHDAQWQTRIDTLSQAMEQRLREHIGAELAAIAQRQQAAVAQAVREERLGEGIAMMDGLRTDIAVYFAEQGKLPQRFADLHYPADWLPSRHLAEVRLHPDAAIELHFRRESGIPGTVRLRPDVRETEMMILGWDCTSADIAYITQAAPQCRYTP